MHLTHPASPLAVSRQQHRIEVAHTHRIVHQILGRTVVRTPRQTSRLTAHAVDDSDVNKLNSLLQSNELTGSQLRDLLVGKWGRSYDVSIQKRGRRVYLHVLWKFLEQQSFPLSESEYMERLDAVAFYLTQWGVCETVRQGIAKASPRGPGYTGGGGAKAISIPLDVDLTGTRSGEWDV